MQKTSDIRSEKNVKNNDTSPLGLSALKINSARWMCCFDSTHQDSKILFYYRYVFPYHSTNKLRLCMERES